MKILNEKMRDNFALTKWEKIDFQPTKICTSILWGCGSFLSCCLQVIIILIIFAIIAIANILIIVNIIRIG